MCDFRTNFEDDKTYYMYGATGVGYAESFEEARRYWKDEITPILGKFINMNNREYLKLGESIG